MWSDMYTARIYVLPRISTCGWGSEVVGWLTVPIYRVLAVTGVRDRLHYNIPRAVLVRDVLGHILVQHCLSMEGACLGMTGKR